MFVSSPFRSTRYFRRRFFPSYGEHVSRGILRRPRPAGVDRLSKGERSFPRRHAHAVAPPPQLPLAEMRTRQAARKSTGPRGLLWPGQPTAARRCICLFRNEPWFLELQRQKDIAEAKALRREVRRLGRVELAADAARYACRAECEVDVDLARELFEDIATMQQMSLEDLMDEGYVDDDESESRRPFASLVFSSKASVAFLRGVLACIPDGHVMVETLRPLETYTGERDWGDLSDESDDEKETYTGKRDWGDLSGESDDEVFRAPPKRGRTPQAARKSCGGKPPPRPWRQQQPKADDEDFRAQPK